MKTGIELIAQERQEQIEKHGRTIVSDAEQNIDGQLLWAARNIISKDPHQYQFNCPKGWDQNIYNKMCNKSHKDRLIIAGALIAAEIDRLNHMVIDSSIKP